MANSIEQISERMNEQTKFEEFKKAVNNWLLLKEPREVTECITNYFLKENTVYSLRCDTQSEMWIYSEGIYIPEARSYIKEFTQRVCGVGYTTHIANEVINKIEARTFINQDKFFSINYVDEIAVKNGILNIKTKELAPFTPKKIFFNKLPVEYVPEKDCPNIKKHFQSVLQHESDTLVIQELFGYLLLKEYMIEKAFMFTGSGRNGKGKSIELMKHFLGADNCSSIPLQQLEESEFAVAGLFGKMANLSGDLSKTALRHTGRFKEATGRDLLTANRKNKSFISFVNYAKLIFACNELPKTRDITTAFFSRWALLHFPYTFLTKEEMDKLEDKTNARLRDSEIIKKLTTPEELSGLLNWALDGLERLLKQKDFSSSRTWEELKIEWLRKSSSLQAFLMDCTIQDYDSHILKKEFQRRYNEYCRVHKIKPEGAGDIKETLSEMGISENRTSLEGRPWKYEGLKFVQDVQDVHGFLPCIGILNSLETSKTLDKSDRLDRHISDFEQVNEEKVIEPCLELKRTVETVITEFLSFKKEGMSFEYLERNISKKFPNINLDVLLSDMAKKGIVCENPCGVWRLLE